MTGIEVRDLGKSVRIEHLVDRCRVLLTLSEQLPDGHGQAGQDLLGRARAGRDYV